MIALTVQLKLGEKFNPRRPIGLRVTIPNGETLDIYVTTSTSQYAAVALDGNAQTFKVDRLSSDVRGGIPYVKHNKEEVNE